MGDVTCAGDWKLEKELGSGGFGVVCLWRNKVSGESLAIKKCRWNLETQLTAKQRERWSLEVQMMQDIQNENIVGYREMPDTLRNALLKSNPSKLPILSMEYCSLGNLRNILLKPQHCCGLPETEVITILKDTSNALIHLHYANITHRDFKPENIVLQCSNTRKNKIIYKVIDLGYAKELNSQTVSFVGTLQYLAPEIFEKQTYDRSVDYWSLGITAFEIICGIRPFLPTFTPIQSFEHVKKKSPDVICIQLTHTGDIKSSKELLKENHINMCLKQKMEKWLRSILQFDPEKRSLIENNNAVDVLKALQNIVSKRIITVFSVYTYEFYSYEISDSTLYSTLLGWIARDTNIQRSDLYVVASKQSNSTYALDYYDEANPDAMLFVFKKNAFISDNVCCNSLPKLIKIMFENIKTEFKCGTLKLLHAQTIYLICQEIKHLSALKNGICFLCDFLNSSCADENKLFMDLRTLLRNILSEIEFHNVIQTSLCKVYKDTKNNKLNMYLLEYENYMHQLGEIIDIINTLPKRQKSVIVKNNKIQKVSDVILNKLGKYDFNTVSEKAEMCYNGIVKQIPIRNLTGGPEILKIISQTIKIRDKVLRDTFLHHFIKGATSYWKELNKLLPCMTAIQNHLSTIKENSRTNLIKRVEISQNSTKNSVCNIPGIYAVNGLDLIKENVSLRYDIHELMSSNILKYKNVLKETEENSSVQFAIENGIGDELA